MTTRARIDTDVIYHDSSDTTFTVGSVSEHLVQTPTVVLTITGTCSTTAAQIVGSGALSTLAVKNTGAGVLRLAGAIDVAAGRVAVLPTTATVTVSAPGGSGSYTAVWLG
jgi:hypothetical protein